MSACVFERGVTGALMTDRARRRVRATIQDVARIAQVSVGTASNVLNNPELVAPSTRARVIEAIQGTGFVRSTAAHQLRVGKAVRWASSCWT
jgi:hypothetical protein